MAASFGGHGIARGDRAGEFPVGLGAAYLGGHHGGESR